MLTLRCEIHAGVNALQGAVRNDCRGDLETAMSNEIKTDPVLLAKLKEAAGRQLTVEEVRAQRVSFIMGNMPEKSAVTRERIESVLGHFEGTRVAG